VKSDLVDDDELRHQNNNHFKGYMKVIQKKNPIKEEVDTPVQSVAPVTPSEFILIDPVMPKPIERRSSPKKNSKKRTNLVVINMPKRMPVVPETPQNKLRTIREERSLLQTPLTFYIDSSKISTP